MNSSFETQQRDMTGMAPNPRKRFLQRIQSFSGGLTLAIVRRRSTESDQSPSKPRRWSLPSLRRLDQNSPIRSLIEDPEDLFIEWSGRYEDTILVEGRGKHSHSQKNIARDEFKKEPSAQKIHRRGWRCQYRSRLEVQKPLTGPKYGTAYYNYPSRYGPAPRQNQRPSSIGSTHLTGSPAGNNTPFDSPRLGRREVVFEAKERKDSIVEYYPVFSTLSPRASFSETFRS